MKNRLLIILLLVVISIKGYSQVTVTGTPYGCTSTHDTLTAHLTGDVPIDASLRADDTYGPVVGIGFTYNFYGVNYTNLVVGANGNISFDVTLTGAYDPWPITAALLGNTSVLNNLCGPWCDIDYFDYGGSCTYSIDGVAPNRKFVVTFCKAYMFNSTDCPGQWTTTQMILYETTNIAEVHIGHKTICTAWNGGYAICGVQNAAGTVATAAPGRDFPTTWAATDEAWRFTPVGGGTSYTVASIPYAPVPYASSLLYWYDSTTGAYLGTGTTLVVSPSVTTTYKAGALGCADTSFGYYSVIVAPGPHIDTVTFTNPTSCGACNGTIKLHGITPGFVDTFDYRLNGVWVTSFFTASLADSTVTLTGLCDGVYDSFAIKFGACTDTFKGPELLTSPPISFSGFTSTNPTYCGACNGSITLHGLVPGSSDTVNYQFNGAPQPPIVVVPGADSALTISPLCEGTYTHFSVKVGFCIDTNNGPVILTDPAFFIAATTFTNPSVCGACDGTITLEGLVPGTSDTVNYLLGGVAQPPVVQVVAAGGTIILTGLCAGDYSGITAKMNDCITPPAGPDTLVNPPFVITGFAFTNTSCLQCNGTITLAGLTPSHIMTINYSFNGTVAAPVVVTSSPIGDVILSGLCPGNYSSITATMNTCVAGPVGPLTIIAPPTIPIYLNSTTNPSGCGKCDGKITISGVFPTQIDSIFYGFNAATDTVVYVAGLDSMVTIYGLCGGTYSNIWMKIGGCPTDTINSATLTAPIIHHGFSDTIIYGCKGDTVVFKDTSFTSGGPLYYEWDFGDSTSDTLSNPYHIYTAYGTYTVIQTVTNNSCTYFDTTVFTLSNSLNAAFSPSPGIVCQNIPMGFLNSSSSGMGGISYLWNFGDGDTTSNATPSHTYPVSGTYTVTLIATNFVPCSDTDKIVVQVDTASAIKMNITDTAICRGTYMTYTGTYATLGNTGVVWNFGNGDTIKEQNPIVYGYNNTGVYTISVTSNYRACESITTTGIVNVIPQPSISLGGDTSICIGSSAVTLIDNLNAENPLANWLWSTGAKTPAIQIGNPGHYWCTVSINNCWATDSVNVGNGCYMDIPNGFTPNGDGVNDYFYPRQWLSKGLASFTMNIYNRWGELVFTTTSIDGRGWDGRFNDQAQPEGVYVFVIDASFIDGQKEHHQGNITLLR